MLLVAAVPCKDSYCRGLGKCVHIKPNCIIMLQRPTDDGMLQAYSFVYALWCRVSFRYYKPETKGLDFEGLMEDVKVWC